MSFSNPDNNVKNLELEAGQRVIIFGSGSGGHTFAAARAMDNNGTVYAIDVRKELLEKLKNLAITESVKEIEIIHANIEKVGGTGLADRSIDAVIIPNTLFMYDEPKDILNEAYRIVTDGGKLMIIDWSSSFGGVGPQPENIIPQATAKEWAIESGFTHQSSFSAGNQHYGLVFTKQLTNKD